jgi:hypothetical protein
MLARISHPLSAVPKKRQPNRPRDPHRNRGRDIGIGFDPDSDADPDADAAN